MAQAITNAVVQSYPFGPTHIHLRQIQLRPSSAVNNCSQPFTPSKCKSLANNGLPSEPRLANDMSSEQITKGKKGWKNGLCPQ